MTQYKEEHLARKQRVLDCLREAETFLSGNGYQAEAESLAKQRENLESEEFSIALVGEFSSGKSTFLNALMGERLLPALTRETTATVNFLRHKDKAANGEAGRVYFKDGRTLTLDVADFETINRYVNRESREEDVAQNVEHLDLFLDSRFLEGNVTLVDTPGLNGIAEGHKEHTQRQIERSSAGIFLFNARQPGSATDFQFLQALLKRVSSVFLALNQIDAVRAGEGETVEDVVESLKKNYRKFYPNAPVPEIWPISAYQALQARSKEALEKGETLSDEQRKDLEAKSRIAAFEDRLWRYLTCGEKTKQMLLTPIQQALDTLSGVKERNQMAKDALEGKVDVADIEGRLLELEKALHEMETALTKRRKDLEAQIRDVEREFFDEIYSGSDAFAKQIARRVENFQDVEEVNPARLEEDVRKRLAEIASEAWEHYQERLRDLMAAECESVTGGLNDFLNDEAMSVSLSGTLTLPEQKIGIEKYEENLEKYDREIQKLERELDKADTNWQDAIKLKRKRDELTRKIEEAEQRRNRYEENKNTFAPQALVRERAVTEEVKRKGLLGGIVNLLVGPQRETRMESYIDDSQLQDHNQKYDAQIESANRKIADLEKEYRAIGADDTEAQERAYQRLDAARRQKYEERKAFQERSAKEFKERNEAQLRQQKTAVSQFVEDMTDEMKRMCKREFSEKRKALAGALTDGIRFSVSGQIDLKRRELENQRAIAKTAVSQRDEEIRRCDAENETVLRLLKEMLSLQAELEDIRTDKIRMDVAEEVET